MKIQNALVSIILDRSQQYFAHVTTVTLSWRVQNIVVIGRVHFTLECFEFSSNFEFDRNMLSGTGAWKAYMYIRHVLSIIWYVGYRSKRIGTDIITIKLTDTQPTDKYKYIHLGTPYIHLGAPKYKLGASVMKNLFHMSIQRQHNNLNQSPTGTRRNNNVIVTSKRRRDVVLTCVRWDEIIFNRSWGTKIMSLYVITFIQENAFQNVV